MLLLSKDSPKHPLGSLDYCSPHLQWSLGVQGQRHDTGVAGIAFILGNVQDFSSRCILPIKAR